MATLPHTPNHMSFLNVLLHRPHHERPYILFPIGYPAHDGDPKRTGVDGALVVRGTG